MTLPTLSHSSATIDGLFSQHRTFRRQHDAGQFSGTSRAVPPSRKRRLEIATVAVAGIRGTCLPSVKVTVTRARLPAAAYKRSSPDPRSPSHVGAGLQSRGSCTAVSSEVAAKPASPRTAIVAAA